MTQNPHVGYRAQTRTGIDSSRIAQASREGLVCKLVGGARRVGKRLELWVKPQFVPRDHALARIEGVDNAVFVQSARAGHLAFHGRGAGGDPTAAAILADVASAARRRVRDHTATPCLAPTEAIGLSRGAHLTTRPLNTSGGNGKNLP